MQNKLKESIDKTYKINKRKENKNKNKKETSRRKRNIKTKSKKVRGTVQWHS